MKKEYEVSGLHCMGCVNIITDEISDIKGVDSVVVSEDFKKLTVEGEGFTDERIKQGVTDAGYEFVKSL